MMLFAAPFALSQQEQSRPLTDDEKREVLRLLNELDALRKITAAQTVYIDRDKEQDTREKQNYEKSLQLSEQALVLMQRERDLEKAKADFYEKAYNSLTKKHGAKFVLCKVFTIGIARCQ